MARGKTYSKGVNAAKVERIIDRVRADKSYKAGTKRLRYAKQAAGRKTQQRAIDFLSKQAGYEKTGSSMGRTQWRSPASLSREQAMSNIASKIPGLPKRSTAKIGSRKIITREQQRQKRVTDAIAGGPGASYMHGKKPADRSRAPLGRQGYDGSTGRRAKVTTPVANRQAARRQVVKTLRGTGVLLRDAARIKRGRSRQMTLGGGTETVLGRIRRR